jgi:hypothetical protein
MLVLLQSGTLVHNMMRSADYVTKDRSWHHFAAFVACEVKDQLQSIDQLFYVYLLCNGDARYRMNMQKACQ